MKKLILFTFLIASFYGIQAQKVDSIYFHLYTDSLKKGQHNYINVDAKMTNGKWIPLTAKDLNFSCSAAKFSGNELIIPVDFKELKVIIKASLKSNPLIFIEKAIWIKQIPDVEKLPTKDEVIKGLPAKKSKPKTKKN